MGMQAEALDVAIQRVNEQQKQQRETKMKSNPFARAKSMMALIALSGIRAALAQMGEYVSRGHGHGQVSGKGRGNPGTNWLAKCHGEPNGEREMARRRRQIARGQIQVTGAA